MTAADVDGLARDTRELMLKELMSLTARARGQPIAMAEQTSGDGAVKASGVEVKNA